MFKRTLSAIALALTLGCTAPHQRTDAVITVVDCQNPVLGSACHTVIAWESGRVAMREGIWGQVGQAIKARPTKDGGWE